MSWGSFCTEQCVCLHKHAFVLVVGQELYGADAGGWWCLSRECGGEVVEARGGEMEIKGGSLVVVCVELPLSLCCIAIAPCSGLDVYAGAARLDGELLG